MEGGGQVLGHFEKLGAVGVESEAVFCDELEVAPEGHQARVSALDTRAREAETKEDEKERMKERKKERKKE